MKKILLGIILLTSLMFAGGAAFISNQSEELTITENVKQLLKEGGISIIEHEDELTVKKNLIKVEKELYCFRFSYEKQPFLKNNNDLYKTFKLKPIEEEYKNRIFYDYNWNFIGNIEGYCFLTKEEAEKAKIEKQPEIKEIIKMIKKEKLKENIIIGVGILIILIIYLTILYYIIVVLKKIGETTVYKEHFSKFFKVIGKLITFFSLSVFIFILYLVFIK